MGMKIRARAVHALIAFLLSAGLIMPLLGVMDPSLFVTDPGMAVFWDLMGQKSLEELLTIIDNCWKYYDQFSEEQLKEDARNTAAFANAYTLSYHFANTFLLRKTVHTRRGPMATA